jgi:hypothetical protein
MFTPSCAHITSPAAVFAPPIAAAVKVFAAIIAHNRMRNFVLNFTAMTIPISKTALVTAKNASFLFGLKHQFCAAVFASSGGLFIGFGFRQPLTKRLDRVPGKPGFGGNLGERDALRTEVQYGFFLRVFHKLTPRLHSRHFALI